MNHYWDTIESPFGTFAAWVDEAGTLVRFNLRATGAAKVDPMAERDAKALSEVRRQVSEYAKGKRQDFELELNAEGPDFNKLVWKALLGISFGRTTSYGAIAKTIGHPAAARGGGSQWRQSHRPDRALPPRDRQRRQSHRLWRRPAAEAQASGA
jgi:methylated-DNA-[protein]-cysteine S-methyltransferase